MSRMFIVSAALGAALVLTSARAWSADPLASDRPAESPKKRAEADAWRLGPVVSLGFPRPFAIEGLLKVKDIAGVGVEYSFLPRMTLAEVRTRFDAIAVDANLYPFKGGFFIGMRAGRQWLSGTATLRVQNFGSFTESADASAWFVNPRIGYLFTWKSGFTLGFDAGLQLPISTTYERSGAATAAGFKDPNVELALRQVAKTLGNDITPTVDLFRVGFLF